MAWMLDTNICIFLLKERPPELRATFNRHAGHIAISIVTLAELLHGAAKSSRPDHNRHQVDMLCKRLQILPLDRPVAEHYADIRTDLERQGQVIGANDLFIAAHARSQDLIVVTHNLREFLRVRGLKVENWIAGGG